MNLFSFSSSLSQMWEIFLLFAIPIGGGIPAGVLMSQSRNVSWVEMTLLYLVSDIMLAFLFEPIMRFFSWCCERSNFLYNYREALKKTTNMLISGYGNSVSPFKLVLIAFGVDPMTGRAAAMAAGHGFISGWVIAITGDMFFFTVVAISTIFLNSFLGDGMWTAVIIMICMIGIPAAVQKIRNNKSIKKGMI